LSRSQFCVLAAAVLIVCLVFTFAASAALSPQGAVEIQPEATPTHTPTTQNPRQEIQPQQNPLLLTEEEALSLAMPDIEQFAQVNKLTLTSVTATLTQTPDNGLRGGPTLDQVLHLNLTGAEAHPQFTTYPAWHVEASFYPVSTYHSAVGSDGEPVVLEESVLMGYSVGIWADTGEIYSSHGGAITE
jgi:hypothetical protein